MRRGIVAMVGLLVLALPATAGARQKPEVSITESKLKPAVLVVAPGTKVKWHNDGIRSHGLVGKVKTDKDIPRGGDFTKPFPIPGRYDYALKDRPDVTGVILVQASGRSVPPLRGGGSRSVTHRYRGTLSLTFSEDYRFYDGALGTLEGPCNAESGGGTRQVAYAVTLRNVRYTRLGSFEGLASAKSSGRVRRGHEHVDARIQSEPRKPPNTCTRVDGQPLEDPPPDQRVGCDKDYAGTRLRMELRWVRSVNQGRFLFDNSGPRIKTLECGPNFIGALAIAGVDVTTQPFPLNVVASNLAWDLGQTSPATAREVGALRAGRAVTINRGVRLSFTADCCTGWVPSDRGLPLRIGTKYNVLGSLRIRLTPA